MMSEDRGVSLLPGLPACLARPREVASDVRISISFEKRTVNVKLVLVGPGDTKRCSKSRALELLYASLPRDAKGELTSIATEGDRVYCFDAPWSRAQPATGLSFRVWLYTVAGACYYEETRRATSLGASGFVLVPSTSRLWRDEGVRRLAELERHLRADGRDLATVPAAFLWMRGSLAGENDPPEDLAPAWNPGRARPEHVADYAAGGPGIADAIDSVVAQVRADVIKTYLSKP